MKASYVLINLENGNEIFCDKINVEFVLLNAEISKKDAELY